MKQFGRLHVAASSPQTAKSSQTEPSGVLPLGSADRSAWGAELQEQYFALLEAVNGTPWDRRIIER